MRYFLSRLLLGVVTLLLSPSPTLAADATVSEPAATLPSGAVDCFDYYQFGSAQADIQTTLTSTVSGSSLGFTGTLTNDNSYPLVDTSVYVKIFRKQTSEALWHQNGHMLVDQFFAAEHIDVPGKGSKPFSFTWKVPSYALSGDYFATTYVVTQKKFNLLGLSFTNDVNGNVAPFSVVGEQKTGVSINPNTLMVGKEASSPVLFPVRVGQSDVATLSAEVTNTTSQTQAVPVTWTLSRWDGIGDGNQLDQQSETITLKPKETRRLTYEVSDTKFPVYFATLQVKYQDTSSLTSLRFVREGIDRLRINFPGVTAYPLQANQPATVFSCLHNSGAGSIVENGKLLLTVKDDKGSMIDSYEYAGDVTGAMMGVKHDFTPKTDAGTFTVEAKLYQNGTLVDESSTRYDCKSLGGNCPTPIAASIGSKLLKNASPTTLLWSIVLVSIIVALIWKMTRSKQTPSKRRNRVPSLNKNRMNVWFLALLAGAAYLFSGTGAEAASVVVSNTIKGKDCAAKISAHSSVTYLGFASSDGTVPVGSTVTFTPELGGISWFLDGFTMDSPYGDWVKDAGDPGLNNVVIVNVMAFGGRDTKGTALCSLDSALSAKEMNNYVNNKNAGLALSVNPPGITYTHDGSTAGLNCSVSSGKETCTVTSTGKIETQMHFGATNGKLYIEYVATNKTSHRILGFIPVSYDSSQLSFSHQAVQPNRPPTPPTIDGPTTGSLSTLYPFTVKDSTDPDNDTIRYGIDWDKNGSVDQWLPASGYIPSGSAQNTEKSWTLTGAKTFQALAEDNQGNRSGWAAHTITITEEAKTLKICAANCSSGELLSGTTISMPKGATKPAVACYNAPATGCSSANPSDNVTLSATWGTSSSAVSLAPDSQNNQEIVTARSEGTPTVSATYNGKSASFRVNVACSPSWTPEKDPRTVCTTDQVKWNDHCGNNEMRNGEKICGDTPGWIETAP